MQNRDAATPLWKEEELPDLHPICFLLCQTTQLQGIAHFLTPPSSKHLSITNLNSSRSVCEWQAKINQLIYLNSLAHIAKPILSHRKLFFAQRQNVLWSLHTFNPERMMLLRVYGKPDRKPCCHHHSQTGTSHGQQSSSAMLWPGSLFPVLYSSPAPGQVSGVPVCIQTLTAIDRRSAILHMDRFTQGCIYIKCCASES